MAVLHPPPPPTPSFFFQHIKVLETKFIKEKLEIGYGSFPYVPLLRCPFYYFVGRKRS
jgi:hypothetical protein